MATTTPILASRYNTLKDRINLVLGISDPATPTFGYGESFSTNGVLGSRAANDLANADKVTAQDYEDLYIDIIRCKSHQQGASNITIDQFVVGDYETNTTSTDKIEEAYVLNLESLASDIETDRFLIDDTNLTLTTLSTASSTRADSSGPWNGIISHIFQVTFDTEVARRHFFNAGGEIRMGASVDYTGSDAKTVEWQIILNNMGTTSFKANETVNNTGVGTASSIGSYDLTSSYQLIYSRTGSAVYANNRYNIYAAENATIDQTSSIIFKVEFIDGVPNDPTWGIDESVLGTFNSNVQLSTPDGEVTINGTTYPTVVIPTNPVGQIVKSLS